MVSSKKFLQENEMQSQNISSVLIDKHSPRKSTRYSLSERKINLFRLQLGPMVHKISLLGR